MCANAHVCVCESVETGAGVRQAFNEILQRCAERLKGFCQIKYALDCSVFCCCCFKCFYFCTLQDIT